MKVLHTKGTTNIVSFPVVNYDADPVKFEEVISGAQVDEVVVGEVPDAKVKADAQKGADQPQRWVDPGDYMRNLRWLNKRLINVPVGTEGITLKRHGKSSLSIVVPEPEGEGEGETYTPFAGDRIVIGSNISPKALMNARGTVKAVEGAKVRVEITEGDARRIRAATGKPFQTVVRLPAVCIERDEDAA